MAKGGNTGAVIFLAIISVGALGISGYMFTMDLLSGKEENGNLKLVALWGNLRYNITSNPLHNSYEDFLVYFFEEMVLDSNYVTQENNTRFSFTAIGIYKINLNMIFYDFIVGETYWVYLLKNNTKTDRFDRWERNTALDDTYHFVHSSVYINVTNVNDYYEINPFCYTDEFFPSADSNYNQLSIEYVVP